MDAVFTTVQIGFHAHFWSCFSGLDDGRSEPVLFIFNRQMSTFVLPVAEIVLPRVPQNGLDRTAYRAPRERRLDKPIITSRGAISHAISDRVGKNRAKQEMTSYCMTTACQLKQLFQQCSLQRAQVTDSQKPISTVMRVCHPYSIMWTILGAWE